MSRKEQRRTAKVAPRKKGVRPLSCALATLLRVAGALFMLEEVSLTRGGAPVLRSFSAEIGVGATALVGPSGAGKSSLLRLLNRLSDPDGGRVLLHGRDVREGDVLALRRRVVLVPQLPAPLAETVAGDVRYAAPDADVASLLERAGLDATYADRETARLSVGEQQRVMLARALALEPEVLLLDEPTSALDEAARDAVEATIGALRSEGRASIVVVTRDVAQAGRLADRQVRLG
jgi:putative ABC transport system ATP-binding protein